MTDGGERASLLILRRRRRVLRRPATTTCRNDPMLYKQSRSQYPRQNGLFSIVPNLPGYAIPEHRDHGYGPLARFDDTTLEPGGFVPMHEHRNDEIITYITDGLVRHADSSGARVVASPTKIMVMNAGKGFWHEEGTAPDDPTLRALQIFVRPHTVDLEPNIQFKEIGTPPLNEWRLLAGPENTEAPSFIRNDVPCARCRSCTAGAARLGRLHPCLSRPHRCQRDKPRNERGLTVGQRDGGLGKGTRGCDRGGVPDQPEGPGNARRHDWTLSRNRYAKGVSRRAQKSR